MKIHVGTRNPLKVKAVRTAFAEVFVGEPVEVIGVDTDGGVPSQPFGEEVVAGAIRRAHDALADADFGVGIEAGLVRFPGCERYFNLQFCVVVDRSGRMTLGHGPGFELPQETVDRLVHGSTLNREMSRISGISEIKESIGAIGYLSGGRIDRFTITRETVLMALIPRIKSHPSPSMEMERKP